MHSSTDRPEDVLPTVGALGCVVAIAVGMFFPKLRRPLELNRGGERQLVYSLLDARAKPPVMDDIPRSFWQKETVKEFI